MKTRVTELSASSTYSICYGFVVDLLQVCCGLLQDCCEFVGQHIHNNPQQIEAREGGNNSDVLPLKATPRDSNCNITSCEDSNLSYKQIQCRFIQSRCGRHVNADQWVCDGLGQNKIVRVSKNSGPVLTRFWTKVHEIFRQCRRPLVLFSALALLSISRFVQKIKRKTEQM